MACRSATNRTEGLRCGLGRFNTGPVVLILVLDIPKSPLASGVEWSVPLGFYILVPVAVGLGSQLLLLPHTRKDRYLVSMNGLRHVEIS